MTRLLVGFPPNMITGTLPPCNLCIQASDVFPIPHLFFKRMSEKGSLSKHLAAGWPVLNSTRHLWVRVCPSWKFEKQTFAATFSLPRYLLFKGKGERWAEFEKGKIPCRALYYAHLLWWCITSSGLKVYLPLAPSTASQCEAWFKKKKKAKFHANSYVIHKEKQMRMPLFIIINE